MKQRPYISSSEFDESQNSEPLMCRKIFTHIFTINFVGS
jgi:hypothetical protein